MFAEHSSQPTGRQGYPRACSWCGRGFAGGVPSVAGKPVHYECYRAAYEANGGVSSPLLIEIDAKWQTEAAQQRAQAAKHEAELDALAASGIVPDIGEVGGPTPPHTPGRPDAPVEFLFLRQLKAHPDLLRRYDASHGWHMGFEERDAALRSGWTGGRPAAAQLERYVAYLEGCAAPRRTAYQRNPRGYHKWLKEEAAERRQRALLEWLEG
jgi:hypothetical protein